MTVQVSCENYARDEALSERWSSPDCQHAVRALIDTLIDIDLEHQRQREHLSRSSLDPTSNHRMLKKLNEQHRQRREPHVQQFVIRQEQSETRNRLPDPSTSGSSPLRG